MLSCENLSLQSYNKTIFKEISLSLLPSSIAHVKGPNGSGKTSLLRIIAGITSPGSGRILLNGININNIQESYSVYIGHNLAIKKNLTVIEMLRYYTNLFDSNESIDASIYYLGLHDILNNRCETLSHGNLKKLAISRLMIAKCNLWLLDEIESNLDENNLQLLHQLIISKANNGGIIIMSSHQKSYFKNVQIINLPDFI
jgi:heme exporter protein A